MEALILILGELVFALLAPFVVLVVDLIGLAVGFTASFLSRKVDVQILTTRLARITAIALACVAVFLLTSIWIVNRFYFEESVHYAFGAAENRSGIEADCRKIEGSLFTGRIELGDCTLRRLFHPASTFDLSIERLKVDLKIGSLLGTAAIQSADVSGLSGWVKNDRSRTGQNEDDDQPEKPRREFVVDRLNMAAVRVRADGHKIPMAIRSICPLRCSTSTAKPLRSRFALFDMLFRSNTSGSIAGAPLEISTSVIQDGRITTWRAEKVPVAQLGALTGGALSWFSTGTVDVFVDDTWQMGHSLSIDMDWRLLFSDAEVAAPTGTGAFTRLASEPLTRYVNGFDGHFPLEFAMVVNENQFEYTSSLASDGLWSAVGDAVDKVLTSFGIELNLESETGNAIREGAKTLLDRLRKPKHDKPD